MEIIGKGHCQWKSGSSYLSDDEHYIEEKIFLVGGEKGTWDFIDDTKVLLSPNLKFR